MKFLYRTIFSRNIRLHTHTLALGMCIGYTSPGYVQISWTPIYHIIVPAARRASSLPKALKALFDPPHPPDFLEIASYDTLYDQWHEWRHDLPWFDMICHDSTWFAMIQHDLTWLTWMIWFDMNDMIWTKWHDLNQITQITWIYDLAWNYMIWHDLTGTAQMTITKMTLNDGRRHGRGTYLFVFFFLLLLLLLFWWTLLLFSAYQC
jgi:hypothetical protein